MPAGLQLPTEISPQIVEHHVPAPGYGRHHRPTLLALCLVSRAWKDVAQPHLWAEALLLFRRPAKQLEAVYTALAANPQLGRFIKKLFFNVYELDSSTLFSTVASLCPNLKVLKLCSSCPLSNEDFYELAENCEKLVELTLVGCPNITAEGWIRAGPFFKQLRSLYLQDFPDFGDKAVRAIVDSGPLLQRVVLYGTDLTCDEISYIMLNAPALVDFFIKGNKRIERRGFEDILCQRPARLKGLCVWIGKDQCWCNGNWIY
ncbi:hypothetical protein DFS34DRAFT_660824 [Phlyctochytrium arcticum]|nr:hypothetical protein DFS34DRAFT_660824 [Phlyctochytrium arcticum]